MHSRIGVTTPMVGRGIHVSIALVLAITFWSAVGSAMSGLPEAPFGRWECRSLSRSDCSISPATGMAVCKADADDEPQHTGLILDLRSEHYIQIAGHEGEVSKLRHLGTAGLFAGSGWLFASDRQLLGSIVMFYPGSADAKTAARIRLFVSSGIENFDVLYGVCTEQR